MVALRMRAKRILCLLVAAFFAGLFAVSYPSLSNWWNARHQSGAISSYQNALANFSKEDFDKYWAEADEYNAARRVEQPQKPKRESYDMSL